MNSKATSRSFPKSTSPKEISENVNADIEKMFFKLMKLLSLYMKLKKLEVQKEAYYWYFINIIMPQLYGIMVLIFCI